MNRESRRQQARDERDQPETEAHLEREYHAEATKRRRTPPAQFLREVRGELRKVAWPNRKEVTSYTFVVLITTAVLTAFTFGLDWVIGKGVFRIFG